VRGPQPGRSGPIPGRETIGRPGTAAIPERMATNTHRSRQPLARPFARRPHVVSTARAFDASAVLAQINSSEMRGSDDDETSRVIPAGTPTANPAWAAHASAKLAGADGYDGLAPVQSLIVPLLDHEPSADEIRRIQAQANQRECLSLVDQQEQLRDCWEARAGLPEPDRIAAVCADLGISAKRAHNLRRQLALPDRIRTRVAERPAGEQISVTMANRLADMHEIAPQLTEAVARRITSTDLHDKALQDLGAFTAHIAHFVRKLRRFPSSRRVVTLKLLADPADSSLKRGAARRGHGAR